MDRQPLTIQQAAMNLQGAANPQAQLSPAEQFNMKMQEIAQRQAQRADQTQGRLEELSNAPKQKDYTAVAALADMFRPQGQQGPSAVSLYQALKPKDNSAQEKAFLQRQLLGQQGQADNTEIAMLKAQMGQGQAGEKFDLQQKLLDAKLRGQKDLASFTADQNIRLAEAKQGMKSNGIGALTKGQESADKEFGKDYQKWVSGGFSNVQGNLDKMSGVLDRINQEDEVGNVVLPEFVRARTNKASVTVEQDVGNFVFQSLKEILGGQFTEKEGQKLVQQTYDPRLSDSDNAKKVEASLENLRNMAEAKQGAVKYFSEKGTLKGYLGSNANNLDEFTKELKSKFMPGESGGSAKEDLMKELGL